MTATPLRPLRARPITAEAFRPFGDLLEGPAAPGRVYYDGGLANGRPAVGPSLSIAITAPAGERPVPATRMERHEFSSQSFVPLDVARYLVMVAPKAAGGGPDEMRAEAFIVPGHLGITYHMNVWHHPMVALDRPARFAIVMWRDGGPLDEEFFTLAHPAAIAVD